MRPVSFPYSSLIILILALLLRYLFPCVATPERPRGQGSRKITRRLKERSVLSGLREGCSRLSICVSESCWTRRSEDSAGPCAHFHERSVFTGWVTSASVSGWSVYRARDRGGIPLLVGGARARPRLPCSVSSHVRSRQFSPVFRSVYRSPVFISRSFM